MSDADWTAALAEEAQCATSLASLAWAMAAACWALLLLLLLPLPLAEVRAGSKSTLA